MDKQEVISIKKQMKETMWKVNQYHILHKPDMVRMELSWYDLLENKLPEEEQQY